MGVSDRVKAELQARAQRLVRKYSLKDRVSKANRKKIAKYLEEIEAIQKKLDRKWGFGVVDGMGARAKLHQQIRDLDTKVANLGGTGASRMSVQEAKDWSDADD